MSDTSTLNANNLASHWNGVYSYDPFPEMPDSLVDTRFELTWAIGWFGRLTGAVVDEHPGIPEQARIVGRVSRNLVRFKKTYGSLWLTDETGSLTQIHDQRSFVIQYEGELEDGGARIAGTWQIPAERRRINGLDWNFPNSKGRWVATPAPSKAK